MAEPGPPYGIPSGIKINGSRWEAKHIPPGISDGLSSKWPTAPYRSSDARAYQIKVAQDWAERDGSAQPDTMYYFDKMPDGYACFEIDQPGGKQIYKRLFGHPSGRFYDSIVRFETHFWWLVEGKKGVCECFLCGHFKHAPGPPKSRKKLPGHDLPVATPKPSIRRDGPTQLHSTNRRRLHLSEENDQSRSPSVGILSTDRARRPARGLATTYPIDEEGTRDVWKEGLTKIHNARNDDRPLEIDIKEEDSADWLSERNTIPEYFTQVEQQHSFIPRIGELVLWCTSFPEDLYLQRDLNSGQYRFYDVVRRQFLGSFPQWRGGIVTAVPSRASKNGAVDFTDILNLPEKKTALNTSGFRVETMPDPNSKDKSLSKQYRYVPLRNVRPLSHWQLLLNGIPQKELHPSVLYAMTCMTSISLMDKYRINGEWRNGVYVYARGMHFGPELIILGDAVRLRPESPSARCTDIMIIDSIRLRLEGMEADQLGFDMTKICARSEVMLLGRAFTTQVDRAWRNPLTSQSSDAPPDPLSLESVKSLFRPVGTAFYGSWYALHDSRCKLEVSYDQLLGRLYEAEAVRLWSGQRQQKDPRPNPALGKPDLGFDMTSIMSGRLYATKVDERIPEPPIVGPPEIRWVLSDYRAQALDIATFNGQEVGPWFEIRTLKTLATWRAHIKISKGEKVAYEETVSETGRRRQNRPSYRIQPLEEFESSQEQHSGKRRGRPPGSKVIDGKVYRAEDLADLTEIPVSKTHGTVGEEVEVPEISADGEDGEEWDDEEEIEIAETQTPHKHHSSMADAALAVSDSEDTQGGDDIMEEDTEPWLEPDEGEQIPTTSQALIAAYGGEEDQQDANDSSEEEDDEDFGRTDYEDGDDEKDDDSDLQNANEESYLSAWKRTAINHRNQGIPSSSTKHSPRPSQPKIQQYPMSKSQIMSSVENNYKSTLAGVNHQEYEESADSDAESILNLDDWKHPRNARGGTEESSGGDYETDN